MLRYGGSPWQRIDIYRAAEREDGPRVVVVHGGFWRHDRTARDLEPLAVAMARRGCQVAVVEYRPAWDGGTWPGVAEDATAALDTLVHDDKEWANGRFVAHSAGAHVLLSGLAGRAGGHRAVLLAPVVDVALAAARGLGDGAAVALTVAHVRKGGAIGDATPRLSPADVSMLDVVVVVEDQVVPLDVVTTQVAAWTAAGLPVQVREMAGAGHMHLVNPQRPAGAEIVASLAAV
ncbi:alpha/beta hydrolase [Micromonospora sp. NPDC047074]|uniref:alpha/beta hydrolase n=1 Tax=Micromonospora sp. NPDC047074 TaxID=3154339 RepID=UPI0033CC1B23